VSGPLVILDAVTGNPVPSWSLLVAGIMAAVSLVPQCVRLWQAGYSWRDVLARPLAADAVANRASAFPSPTADEFGGQAALVLQARSDRQAILKIVDKLPASERNLLPDILATADALLKRAEELARMLHTMSGTADAGAVGRLERKITVTEGQAPGPERDRQLNLLQRQHQSLLALDSRRRQVVEQLESCGLAMQNVRFDLLRLKSAGVAVVLSDLTHATEQARALSREVDHVIEAAGEIREALGEASPPPLGKS
jgi:serine/threonine-protein kinase